MRKRQGGWKWVGEVLLQNELKEIKSLVKGRWQCGNGDFHRMEKILNNHGKRWANVKNFLKIIFKSFEAYLFRGAHMPILNQT